MDYIYILSQVCVVISYALLAITYVVKNRKQLLILNFGSLIATAVGYALLAAWTGMVMTGVAAIRNIIFLIQNRKTKSNKITWVDVLILLGLVAISVLFTIFTYDGFLSLLSVFATLLYTVSVWQKNTTVYKFLGIPVSALWIGYNIYVNSIFGIILESLLLFSVIVGIIITFVKDKNVTKYVEKQEKDGEENDMISKDNETH